MLKRLVCILLCLLLPCAALADQDLLTLNPPALGDEETVLEQLVYDAGDFIGTVV